MTTMNDRKLEEGMTETDQDAFFRKFEEVWDNYALEGILEQFCDDAVYEASIGPETWGYRAVGKEAIGLLIKDVFERIPDLRFHDEFKFYSPELAVVEGRQTGTLSDGQTFNTSCVDILVMRDGKIAAKRAYRKDHQ